MEHGNRTEDCIAMAAIRKIADAKGVDLEQVQYDTPGLTIRPDLFFLGASADRIVRFEPGAKPVLIEVKSKAKLHRNQNEEPVVTFDRHYYDQVQGQLAICGAEVAYLAVGYVQDGQLNHLEIETIEFNSGYWEKTLLPNLKFVYFHLLVPLFMLREGNCLELNTLNVVEKDQLAEKVSQRLLSETAKWTLTSGSAWNQIKNVFTLPPACADLSQLQQLLSYQGVGIGIKSTIDKAAQYLEAPDPKFCEEFWYAMLDDAYHMFVFTSTGSMRTHRGRLRCYTVVLLFPTDPSDTVLRSHCTCKNGTSGRCGHVAAALLALFRYHHGETVHPVRPWIDKVSRALPHLTMANKSGGAARHRGDPSLSTLHALPLLSLRRA